MQRLLHILQLIAGSGKLSQGLKVKPDDFSNCLLQFIIEEKSCTQSYLYFLQGDMEDICGKKKRMMSFAPILLWSSKQHIEEWISRAVTKPGSVTPCPTFTKSVFALITLMDDECSFSGWRKGPVQPCLQMNGNVLPLYYTFPLIVMWMAWFYLLWIPLVQNGGQRAGLRDSVTHYSRFSFFYKKKNKKRKTSPVRPICLPC